MIVSSREEDAKATNISDSRYSARASRSQKRKGADMKESEEGGRNALETLTWSLSPFLRRVLRIKSLARCWAGAGSNGRSWMDLSRGSPNEFKQQATLAPIPQAQGTRNKERTDQDRSTSGQRFAGRTPAPACEFGGPSRSRWRRRRGCRPGRCRAAIQASGCPW